MDFAHVEIRLAYESTVSKAPLRMLVAFNVAENFMNGTYGWTEFACLHGYSSFAEEIFSANRAYYEGGQDAHIIYWYQHNYLGLKHEEILMHY